MAPERQFYVWRRMYGTQLTIVTASSKADALRRVRKGQGEPVDFRIDSVETTTSRVEEVGV